MKMNNLDIYNQYREKMKTGDGLGFRSSGPVATLIRLWSKDLNHFALVQEFPTYCGPEQRRWTSEAIAGGVAPRFLSKVLGEYEGDVWWYPLRPEWAEYRQTIGEKATELYGLGYDFPGLLKNIFSRVSLNLARLWCSEYVQAVYFLSKMIPESPGLYPSEIPELGLYQDRVQIIYYKQPEPHSPVQP